MNNGYCVFFGEKPCFITSQMSQGLYALCGCGGTIIVNQPSPAEVLQTIHDLDRTDAEAAIILTNQVDYYWRFFKEQFTCIDAAGGLVSNEKDELLFIFRRGKWDFPKGKLDPGETLEACAVREVQEETGLQHVEPGPHLCNTWHVYHERGTTILKQSIWYKMTASSQEVLVPQTEEDITSLKWVPKDLLHEVLSNTYPSIREVLRQATLLS
jgi:8-oxo-dGTP pyrophosphatase MutT (NUDIX family)